MRDYWWVKAIFLAVLVSACVLPAHGIIIRHDVDDQKFIIFGRKFAKHTCQLTFPGCGGVLIAPKWVLTAGHCVDDWVAGTSVKIGGRSCPSDSVIIHPARENGVNLALVHLAKPINHVKPIRLYRGDDELGKELIIVGYGYKGSGLTGTEGDDNQIRAGTNVVDKVKEKWLIFTFDEPGSAGITDLECVGGPGDTGSPAFLEADGVLYTLGVNAWQLNTGLGLMPGHYGVKPYYVRISKFVDWIESVIEKHGDKLPAAGAVKK